MKFAQDYFDSFLFLLIFSFWVIRLFRVFVVWSFHIMSTALPNISWYLPFLPITLIISLFTDVHVFFLFTFFHFLSSFLFFFLFFFLHLFCFSFNVFFFFFFLQANRCSGRVYPKNPGPSILRVNRQHKSEKRDISTGIHPRSSVLSRTNFNAEASKSIFWWSKTI